MTDERFRSAPGFEEYLETVVKNRDLWHAVWARARPAPEVGWWGPRPIEIQAWVLGEGLGLPSPERYKVIRGWYARDRGATTLRELLEIVPEAA